MLIVEGKKLYTGKEVAELLGTDEKEIKRLNDSNRLRGRTIGDKVYYPQKSLQAFAEGTDTPYRLFDNLDIDEMTRGI